MDRQTNAPDWPMKKLTNWPTDQWTTVIMVQRLEWSKAWIDRQTNGPNWPMTTNWPTDQSTTVIMLDWLEVVIRRDGQTDSRPNQRKTDWLTHSPGQHSTGLQTHQLTHQLTINNGLTNWPTNQPTSEWLQ